MSRIYKEAFEVDSRSSAHPWSRPDFFTSPPDTFESVSRAGLSRSERLARLRDILRHGIHGLAFSPYLDGQSPGNAISEEQILARLEIIRPHTRWIRTFSCVDGNQETPRLAHGLGLRTMVGVDLGPEQDKNEIELENGLAVAQAGHADILAVGNEVLLRGDLSEDDLLAYLLRAQEAAPEVQVGYVDAYFLFEKHPRLLDVCDVILINCYPFWEYCPAEYAHHYMRQMYARIARIARGKRVIISETGWPSQGTPYGGAAPGFDNALDYCIDACGWCEEAGIDLFYFAAYDEAWKTGDEGDVGAYWGLWDKDGQFKYE